MRFSQVVLQKMQEKNLRISDIARATGFTWTYCRDLLRGKRRWNEDAMLKVCKFLGIQPVFVPVSNDENEPNDYQEGCLSHEQPPSLHHQGNR